MPVPPMPPPMHSLQSHEQGRIQAERLVAEAASLAKFSGLAAMLQEVNRGRGPFGTRNPSDLHVVVFDLKGRVLAYAGNVRHVGMDHGKAVSSLLSFSEAQHRGWYPPQQNSGVHAPKICFERLDHALITVELPMD